MALQHRVRQICGPLAACHPHECGYGLQGARVHKSVDKSVADSSMPSLRSPRTGLECRIVCHSCNRLEQSCDCRVSVQQKALKSSTEVVPNLGGIRTFHPRCFSAEEGLMKNICGFMHYPLTCRCTASAPKACVATVNRQNQLCKALIIKLLRNGFMSGVTCTIAHVDASTGVVD